MDNLWISEEAIQNIIRVLNYNECTIRVRNARQIRDAELASLQTSNEHTPEAEVAHNGIRYAASERMVRYALELDRLRNNLWSDAKYQNGDFYTALPRIIEVQPLYENYCAAQAEYKSMPEPVSVPVSTEPTLDEQVPG